MTSGQASLEKQVEKLVARLAGEDIARLGVIPWASPVPVFGDPQTSRVASLGINPSVREFTRDDGSELEDHSRRLQTLRSLGLKSWRAAEAHHIKAIAADCRNYFHRAPYDRWFKPLDSVVVAAGATYYGMASAACHFDLVPFATQPIWGVLAPFQRAQLLETCSSAFASLVRASSVDTLILNGQAVVHGFEAVAGVSLAEVRIPEWTLWRKGGKHVPGVATWGIVTSIGPLALGRALMVLGFNHNLQSSYGVTREVLRAVRAWVALMVKEDGSRGRTKHFPRQ